MAYGKIKHVFPGGNTSQGFFSYYANIMTQEEANRFIIIKGGPGVGKSTFMKKVGEAMLKRGYDVEYLHCSSDNNSLDGVKIPKLQIAMIDGTSPHVVDPKNPGAVDEILNFGEFWNDKGIRIHKDEIIETNKKVSHIFARAYKYLKAANAIYEDSALIYKKALSRGEVNYYTSKLIETIFKDMKLTKEQGKERALFASAITPNGLCHYLDDILIQDVVYELKGSMGTDEVEILERVKSAAIERGYFVEAFYCALRPGKIEHLVIPYLNIALTTSNDYHTATVTKSKSIDMQQFYNQKLLNEYQEDLDQNKMAFDYLMSIALQTIGKAKALHDQLEAYYIPNVNFEEIDKCFEKIIIRILEG